MLLGLMASRPTQSCAIINILQLTGGVGALLSMTRWDQRLDRLADSPVAFVVHMAEFSSAVTRVIASIAFVDSTLGARLYPGNLTPQEGDIVRHGCA